MRSQYHKSMLEIDVERNLILKAQVDIDNFEPLYNQNFERIFRFVYHRVESKEESADISSQVFLKAMLHIKNYKPGSIPFSAWLFRIAINEISNHYLRTKKSRSVDLELSQLNEFKEGADEELKEDRINNILDAIKKLPEKELLLIELRFFEGRSFKEISDILNITENNAKVKVYRVLDKIKLQIH